jgi:hypothetical protein
MGGLTRTKIIGCVFVLTLVAYHAAPQGGFVWDDVPLLVDDARLSSWSNAGSIALSPFWAGMRSHVTDTYAQVYRPVVSLAYLVQRQLFGTNASGFHVVSVLLHMLCIALVAGWLVRRVAGVRLPALLLALVVFALHPSRVETVAWISGSTDLWMTVLALFATGVWARGDSLLRAGVAGVLVGLAVLAKEPAIVLPALWLSDAVLLEPTSQFGRFGVLRRWVVALGALALVVSFRLSVVAITVSNDSSNPLVTLHRATATLGDFVMRTVVPWPITAFPAVRLVGMDGFETGQTLGFSIGVTTLLGVAVLLLLARSKTSLRPYAADALWFLLPLVPVMNIVDTNATTLVSDRFLYLPLVGVVAMLARFGSAARLGWSWAPLVALPLLWMTVWHVPHFRSDAALWGYELDVDPKNLSAIGTLSEFAEHGGDHQGALALCKRGYQVAFERKTSDRAIQFALCHLRMKLVLAPDDDQTTVAVVRDTFDRLMATGKITVNHGDLVLDVGVREDQQAAVFRSPSTLLLPRAHAHARTGNYAEAANQARAILRAFPQSAEAAALLRSVER